MDLTQTHYAQLGGEQGVYQLATRFYEIMDTIPEAWELRQLHPQDLTTSRDKLFKFLSGWLGGPSLYIQEYGHPMLRARHLPFPINLAMRDQWLLCMDQALNEQVSDTALKQALQFAFRQTADHMRNQAG
ncbi:group II truncated hemoglobin [Thiofilum flexile]|uniref:group II truncated hemoglobin n=1 Tax=Thiofilum flexile TaxID=125627 RepID=UPI0003640450|nr:group II truncated hemoglobin [Thiofilum flexile]